MEVNTTTDKIIITVGRGECLQLADTLAAKGYEVEEVRMSAQENKGELILPDNPAINDYAKVVEAAAQATQRQPTIEKKYLRINPDETIVKQFIIKRINSYLTVDSIRELLKKAVCPDFYAVYYDTPQVYYNFYDLIIEPKYNRDDYTMKIEEDIDDTLQLIIDICQDYKYGKPNL